MQYVLRAKVVEVLHECQAILDVYDGTKNRPFFCGNLKLTTTMLKQGDELEVIINKKG